MRKKILSIYENHYNHNLPYDKSGLEEWKECLKATPLEEIEKACQKEGIIFRKHMKVPKEKKRAANGKYYTIVPLRFVFLHLRPKWYKKWDEIKSKNPDFKGVHIWASDFFPTEVIECTGHYIDTIALPIVKNYKDKKRCPIRKCYKKYELKGKGCYITAPPILIEHVNIVTNKRGYRIPYLLDMKICGYTREPYLIELIPKILVMELNKLPSDMNKFREDLICPHCACDRKESLYPMPYRPCEPDYNYFRIFSLCDFDLLGKEVYWGGKYSCNQCSQQFNAYVIPSSSFETLESHEEFLKRGEFDVFKKIMQGSNV